jgi:L-lactate dehydrogenase complex protein LldG
MDRSAFLERVRRRLADVPKPEVMVPLEWSVDIDDPVARFATEVAANGGTLQRTTEADAPWVLAEWPGATVLISAEPGVPEGLDEVIARAGGRALSWPRPPSEVAEEADVGVTSALWGVAETGSVLVSSAAPGGRAPSLLPPVHLCFLPAARILRTTAELFARIGEMPELPSNLVLISGPSKSADIGQELIVGIHGPGELHVVLVEQAG